MIKTALDDSIIREKCESLRPVSFDEYVGQKNIVNNLKVYISAAKSRGEALDHVLLYGPPGLGKTTLASIIANELGVSIKTISAPAIEKAGDLVGVLNMLNEGDCLFVDEIHRLPKPVEEVLYSAMEDYKICITIGKDAQVKTVTLDLPNFTLIGATTKAGMVSAPLRDRFGIVCKMDFYNETELSQIIKRSADVLSLKITKDGISQVAKASRGTPRIANRFVKRIRDFASVEGVSLVSGRDSNAYLKRLGIESTGLTKLDMDIISCFSNVQTIGLETLAAMVGEDAGTIEDVCEPYLIYRGILLKTSKGRMLSEAGNKLLHLK